MFIGVMCIKYTFGQLIYKFLSVVLQSTGTKCYSLTSVGDNERQDDDLMFYSTLCNCCEHDEMIIGLMGIKNKFKQFIYMCRRRRLLV